MIQMLGYLIPNTHTRRFNNKPASATKLFEFRRYLLIPQRRSLLIQVTMQMKLKTTRTTRVVETLMTIIFPPEIKQKTKKTLNFTFKQISFFS